MATHSSILAGKSHGWRSVVGYSCGAELDVTEQFHSLILIKYNIDKKLNTSCMHILVNNY